jgi:two-component system CheB/CheR fusion protein
VDALFRDLLIGVTEFFRDPQAWRTLETEVITPLLAAKRSDEPIRIWVPGCSTGEEAYTMAMLVLDRMRRARKTCPLQIFATDTNNDALEVGRSGRYPIGIAGHISPARLKRYFVKGPDSQHFTVSEALRSAVVFGSQNMFSDPPFGRVDLISCRNVLIYLESDLQKRVLNIFHFALRKEGYLLLGSAESNSMRDDLFNPISKKWRIFQRMGSVRADTLALPTRVGDSRPGFQLPVARSAPPLSQVASIAQKLILDRFAPASVLIDSRNEALYFCGPTDDFLVRPRGAPVQDLLLLVREGLRSRLRAALSEAAATNLTVSVTGARMKRGGGFAPVKITVTPHPASDSRQLYLVVFRHDQQPSLLPPEKSPGGELVRHLEEELQSLNEELTTVNQQLEVKVRELEEANTDLNNLLNSSEIATICLDRTLHIKWYTPAAHNLFKFLPADLGRPIGDFALAQGGTGVIETATAVLANKAVTLQEFESASGRCYMRRALPYRDEKNDISGIILTYTDITESRLADQAARLARKDLDESHDRSDKMRTLSAALAMAETRERRLLAQDLHDDLGQMLAMIKLKITTMEKLEIPDHMRSAMTECARAVDQANRKVRVMAFQLSPPMLDELGLAAAIEWMADEMHQMYGLDVHTRDDGKPKPMNPAVNATLFRAVRELLINIAKHAGVTRATVTPARGEDDTLILTVSDAGKGFDPGAVPASDGSGRFGLLSVRERINLLGGEVSIRSNPDDGTTVVINVPLLLGRKSDAKTVPRSES